MKKICFSITKSGKFPKKFTGYGYITDEDLIAYPDTKYQRIFEDCVRYCHPIINKPNQYKGTYTEYKEAEVKKDYYGYGNDVYSYDKIETETTYYIWYKVL